MVKRKYSKEQLKAIHANRTYQSRNRDDSQKAQHTYPDTAENRAAWVDNPRRVDIDGLDTPHKSHSTQRNKSQISDSELSGVKHPKTDKEMYEVHRRRQGIEEMESRLVNEHDLRISQNRMFIRAPRGKEKRQENQKMEKIDKTDATGYTGLAAAQIESVNRLVRKYNNHVDKYGTEGWESLKSERIEIERKEIEAKMPKVLAEMEEQKASKLDVDPVKVKINELEREYSNIQTKKNEHQYIKVSTENERAQKRKVQAHYNDELGAIRAKLRHLEAAL